LAIVQWRAAAWHRPVTKRLEPPPAFRDGSTARRNAQEETPRHERQRSCATWRHRRRQHRTGSVAAAFLAIPAAMLLMTAGTWAFTPEHAGQERDTISV
jgi:hypothetical protein